MARLVLPIAGAVVGYVVSGPTGAQYGWMAGAALGALIPTNTRGPSIDETGAQTTAEGAPRAIVYGTAMVTGNVIDAGKTRKITRKQRQGKGGSSTTTEALLRTYAIRMCEGPIGGIIMVKKDDKIVYDVRPGADFDADNAEFMKGCRLYLGGESQLPDPDLEAINGVGEVPAYRGSAYIVFIDDDVTDRRGSVPQYQFVIGNAGRYQDTAIYLAFDSSGSMRSESGNGNSRWENAREAVVAYLNALRPLSAIVRLDLCVVMWGGLGPDPLYRESFIRRSVTPADIDAAIEFLPQDLAVDMGTSFPAAVADATQFFADSPAELVRQSLFITDGEPSTWTGSSWLPSSEAVEQATASGALLLGIENIQARAFNIDQTSTAQTQKMDNSGDAVPVLDGSDPAAIADALRQTIQGSVINVTLQSIVEDVHQRCGHRPSDFDASALNDQVDGLVFAQADYTGADAINTLRAPYFFDRAEWGGQIRYIKRGQASVATIGFDDLVNEPDNSERQAQIEYPRKLHLTYQSAAVNYDAAQATSERVSPDVQVVSESSMQVPVVLAPALAAQMAAKLHKVAWAEATGEVKFGVPESWIRLVPSDCVVLNLRGTSRRLRIDSIEHSSGQLNITARVDRASAYVSTASYIPLPAPTKPVSGIVGETTLAVLDIPALRDQDDSMVYYAAVTGAKPAWRGAVLQRSFDAGASFDDVQDMAWPATIGELTAGIAAASPWYTDTTNIIELELIREGDSIDAITEAQLLARGGGIALQLAGGGWEIAQYRDVQHIEGRRYALSNLHRGQLNTVAGAHAAGQLLVVLDDVSRVTADSAWLNAQLTHRAPSFGASTESAEQQTLQYAGNAQREWPVAWLTATRSGSVLHAVCVPRHRFGNDTNPVASSNFAGWRWTVSSGSASVALDSTAPSADIDTTGLIGALTLSVAQLNRITGPGPATTIEV